MTPKERLYDLTVRVNALSLRERALILLASLAILVVIWDSLLMLPLRKQATRINQQIDTLNAEMSSLQVNISEISRAYQDDPDRVARAALERARKAISDLDEKLSLAATELLDPREMVTVLEEVLANSEGLSLQGLRSLGAQPIMQAAVPAPTPAGAPPATPTAPVDNDSAQIYRHRVELKLQGSYLDALAYLDRLEKQDRRIFWESFKLELVEYPRVDVRVVVYTLGLRKGWLGV